MQQIRDISQIPRDQITRVSGVIKSDIAKSYLLIEFLDEVGILESARLDGQAGIEAMTQLGFRQ